MNATIDQAISEGSVATLAAAFEHSNASDIQYAARRLRQEEATPQSLVARAESLARHDSAPLRVLACHLLTSAFSAAPAPVTVLLERFLDDEDTAVREAAATASGRILRRHFDGMLEVVARWRTSSSSNVRRAAAVAAGRAAHPRHLEWAEPLLRLVEPLLADRDPLVRRALGPSALGRGVLRSYPTLAFEYLTQWSTSNDEQVLWNVAMAFSTPAAATMARKALIILRKLSLDERRFVWRAVATAMWKLGRRCPEIVRPELARWAEDAARSAVAREALKHL
jgi:3-methyladenine DNA glycosylase AlkC